VTLEEAHDQIRVQAEKGGGYGRNSAKLILAEVEREHGQEAVDHLIRAYNLESVFDLEQGMSFIWEEAQSGVAR
jgi:hypothetical protein